MAQNISSFEERYHQKHNAVTLGTDQQTQQPITVSFEDLHSGTTIIGVQGSGKTSIAINLGLQEMKAGASLICLDPSTGADMIRDLISRMPADKLEKTYYLTIKEESKLYAKHPFSLNIFSYANPGSVGVEARAAAKNQIFLAFDKLFPATDGVYFQEILRNLIPLLLDHPTFTLFDIEDFLLEGAFRSRVLEQIEHPRVTRYWYRFATWSNTEKNKLIGPFLRRLGQLLDDEFIPYHIGQKRGLLDIRKAILNGEILLIHLPLDDMAYRTAAPVMGTLLMMQIYAATFSFGNLDRDKRPNFCLLVDEFTKWVYDSGDEFKDLFSFGRKYGISQVLLMQYTSQLDEENLKSLKDGITSAKIMISLRSTLQDGPHLAPLYTGLKRRPTSLYRDVLSSLGDEKNQAFLKEFYWDTVRPLQIAAKLHEDRKTGEQPSYNFGFGMTAFEPAQVTATLNHLNDFLYYSQKEASTNQSCFQLFWRDFVKLNEAVACFDVADEEGIQKRQALEEKIVILKKIENGYPPPEEKRRREAEIIKAAARAEQDKIKEYNVADEESLASLEQKVTRLLHITYLLGLWDTGTVNELDRLILALQRKMGDLYAERNQQFYTFLARHHLREEDYEQTARELGLHDGMEISSVEVYTGGVRKESLTDHPDKGRGKYSRLCVPQHFENSTLYYIEVAEFTRVFQERRLLQWVKEYYREYEQKSRQEAYATRYELQHVQETISPTRKVEDSRLREQKKLVQRVVEMLIAEPLAADKAELSTADIANALPHLADRHGYIKTPSGVFAMKTTDLNRPVSLDETSTRWNTILSQTKKKYCQKGRAEINQEIKSAFKNSLPVQEKTKEPEKRELEEETSPQKQPKKKSQDVFDMLDANESTE